ncbi:MAG: hypothetical protein NTX03_13270 [Bacteroidetes bacterium]|nr:hypothetical protein [Bacteroidota bacterium]
MKFPWVKVTMNFCNPEYSVKHFYTVKKYFGGDSIGKPFFNYFPWRELGLAGFRG